MAKLFGRGTITEIERGKKYLLELSCGKDPATGIVYESPSAIPQNALAIDEHGKNIYPRLAYKDATDEQKARYARWKTPAKYIRKKERFLGTRRQAERRIEEMRAEAERGPRSDADKITFVELSNEFISRQEKNGVNRRTKKPLKEASKTALRTTERVVLRVKWFIQMRVVDISGGDILKLYDELREMGVGATTLYKCHKLIGRIMRYAVKVRVIGYNPLNDLEDSDVPLKPEPNRKPLTKEVFVGALSKLLENEPNAREGAVLTAMCTGLRRGEILGLQWPFVHLDGNKPYLEIKQQLTKEGDVHETKTSSTHVVPVDNVLRDYLLRWRDVQEQYLKTNELPFNDETPVFTNAVGTWYDPNKFGAWFRQWSVSQGLGYWADEDGRRIIQLTIGEVADEYDGCIIEWRDDEGWPCDEKGRRYSRSYQRPILNRHYTGLKPHELRHTYFTLRIADKKNPIDIKTAQALGGWSTPDMLLRVYAHEVEENVFASAGFIDEMLPEKKA
ncbi:MAG: hypothetical protein IJ111_06210 [Eggerthellaceae bacterium]|nr:hypothetical protein [Eggerthellaceae bacterium]